MLGSQGRITTGPRLPFKHSELARWVGRPVMPSSRGLSSSIHAAGWPAPDRQAKPKSHRRSAPSNDLALLIAHQRSPERAGDLAVDIQNPQWTMVSVMLI